MPSRAKEFRTLSAEAAHDTQLRGNLRRAAGHFKTGRERGQRELPHLETRLQRARAVRLHTLAHLPELLEELETNVTAAGGEVHWAADAAEARRIVLDIATARGAKLVVKGKSMVTEEIELNLALIEAGIETVETDLGEYIVQLAGQPPSHIVAPAVHMSRAQVAELFHKKLGRTGQEPEELTAIARQVLREKFLAADMGVTGVNMAIASTGTIVLVENEGNIRMSSTIPGVHVAVMSLEKVTADPVSATDVLQVLPRSATGQRLSTYTSWITGPRRDGETDGPENFHLVILDNGRSRILADPELRETLCCIRCGACLTSCPVYNAIGGHAYGWVYSGPIGSLLTPQLTSMDEAADLPAACTGCRACAQVCPVGIDHPEMFMAMRRRRARPAPGPQFLSSAIQRPGLWRASAAVTRLLDPELKKLSRAPGMGQLAAYAATRRLPRLKTPFSRRWSRLRRELG